jgi:hypothetical protein
MRQLLDELCLPLSQVIYKFIHPPWFIILLFTTEYIMAKKPSDATLLRQAKETLIRVNRELADTRVARNRYQNYALIAAKEMGEWKDRFDILLRRDTK